MKLVIVESPAKAKTINNYLGSDYTVLASYGHVRDLPSKDGSVRPDSDFAMDWEVSAESRKHMQAISAALKTADHLYLATDPDREGEAISWHVQEVLKQNHGLDGKDVKRVVFHEITKSAIKEAMEHPRDLDVELVEAYLARRALDYLVGFTLSPVLWRKLPGSRSAGRVQSVALRLISERETEIEAFKPQEYWSVAAELVSQAGTPFTAQLTHLGGKKLDKLAIKNEAEAEAAVRAVEAKPLSIVSVERKKTKRNPAPAFTTSTLQQEAARKLGFSAKRTMQVAQKLYEGIRIGSETVGVITYMRTDSVNLANEAINACRDLIVRDFGPQYRPEQPRYYKSKSKNAQEAHEAVRPTDVRRRPADIQAYLDPDQNKLYDLIWKRTVACQMESAILDQVAADIAPADRSVTLRATGSVIAFDGFIKVYREGRDEGGDAGADQDADESERILPDLQEGQPTERKAVTKEQHFTQPPPRFTEASLVKRLEELGIGRPSTYASIISVLQDRGYVRLDQRRFFPEDRGRLVTSFLSSFFHRYVEYDFTAELEDKLDEVANGNADWKQVLRDFWQAFSAAVKGTEGLRVSEVLDKLDEELGPHFFPKNDNGVDPRVCPSCGNGRLNLKLGKFGAFVGCSNYPECRYTRPLAVADGEAASTVAANGPENLGIDAATGLGVTLRKGPYGFYVQLGEAEPAVKGKKKGKEKAPKPKRASLLKGQDPAAIDLAMALSLLSLPREIGPDPETKEPIYAGIGRFGPYIRLGGTYVSLKDDDVLTIGLNRAVSLLADKPKKPAPKTLGNHPDDGKPITIRAGRYGSYLQHGSTRANLPKGTDVETLTVEQAVPLIAAKAGGKTKAKAKGKAKAKPEAETEATAEAAPAEKPARKKTAKAAKAKKKAAVDGA
jgi:DNA topoisomerase-1